MVDVSDKRSTKRTATATGRIYIPRTAYDLVITTHSTKDLQHSIVSQEDPGMVKARRKGDTLTVAQLAAIMGAKRTSDLVPLCHPLSITSVQVTLTPEEGFRDSRGPSILCQATVCTEGKTGVEMEALTAVSVGLLTVWDMLKAVAGKDMEIGEIFVSHKSGGRSGDFERKVAPRKVCQGPHQ